MGIYAGLETKIGPDGIVPYALTPAIGESVKPVIQTDGCCPPHLCDIEFESLACGFIDLLPNGPRWDKNKVHAKEWLTGLTTEPPCPSMSLHSIYVAAKFYSMLQGPILEMIRESNPYTARTTVADWLDRLGWQNCLQPCSLGPKKLIGQTSLIASSSTYANVDGLCVNDGSTNAACDLDYPDDLQCYLDHATVTALARLRRHPVGNLAVMNWILEPLGVEAIRDPSPVLKDDNGDEYTCNDPDNGCCEQYFLLQMTTQEYTNWCHDEACPPYSDQPTIDAWYEPTQCDPAGLPQRIYPALDIALCIATSMVQQPCRFNVRQDCNTAV